MKIIHKDQTKEFKNSDACVAVEYPSDGTDINGSVVKLSGRYPTTGKVVNLKCKEMAYVIKGSGSLVVEDKEVSLQEGDLAIIEPGEKYFWDGNMTMFVSCTPAWYSEQHQEVK